jgi:hypothetical protein
LQLNRYIVLLFMAAAAVSGCSDHYSKTTDVVSINFSVAAHRSFWRPVHDTLGNFSQNLASGISQAITAIAYIVPWAFVIIPLLYLFRLLWRRRGGGQ